MSLSKITELLLNTSIIIGVGTIIACYIIFRKEYDSFKEWFDVCKTLVVITALVVILHVVLRCF